MNLRTADGRHVDLGAQLGRGGEASIYEVTGMAGVAAKIYHSPDGEHQQKVDVMIQRPPSSSPSHVTMAWPDALLFDSAGRFVGFTMPRLPAEARTIFTAFHPAKRAVQLPGFTYRYVVHAAANLAEAMALVHHAGHVIGDVNESNALVTPSALVTLVDCDSMQIQGADRTYRCRVTKAEYLAPELVGKSLDATDRTESSDVFALAVLVHQLLLNGVRPHDGVAQAVKLANDVSERIRLGQTPLNPASGIDPSPFAPSLDALPPHLREMLRLSFSIRAGDRPSSREWARTLRGLTQDLKACPTAPDHLYFDTATECPWCSLMRRGAPDAFGPRAPRQQQARAATARQAGRPGAAATGRSTAPTGPPPPPAGQRAQVKSTYRCAWSSGPDACISHRMIDSRFCWDHASRAERDHAQRLSPNGCVAVTQRQKPCRSTPGRYASSPTCWNHGSGWVWQPTNGPSSTPTAPPPAPAPPPPPAPPPAPAPPGPAGTPPAATPSPQPNVRQRSRSATTGAISPSPPKPSVPAGVPPGRSPAPTPVTVQPPSAGAASQNTPSGCTTSFDPSGPTAPAGLNQQDSTSPATASPGEPTPPRPTAGPIAIGLSILALSVLLIAVVSPGVARSTSSAASDVNGFEVRAHAVPALAAVTLVLTLVVAWRRPDYLLALGRALRATGKFTVGVLKVTFHVVSFIMTTTSEFLGWLFSPGYFMRIVWLGVGVTVLVSGCTAVLQAVGIH